MTQQHSITPPAELVQQWVDTYFGGKISQSNFHLDLANRAAQWGADQELEACCEWVDWKWSGIKSRELRASRRFKPPSLKEQALECLKNINDACESEGFSRSDDTDTIRRALESLPD
jgi:predicted HD phosphohydrolase